MTDQNIPDTVEDESTYNKETTRYIGDDPIDTVRKKTDIDELEEQKDIVMKPCSCGNTELDPDAIYVCSRCGIRCCNECYLRLSRRIRCPDCAEDEFHLSKRVYITLFFLDKGILNPEELATAEPADIELGTVTIDPAATTLIQYGYIQTDDNTAGVLTDLTAGNDDPLSISGKEALHVGEHLYGEDSDIKEMKEQAKIERIADQ